MDSIICIDLLQNDIEIYTQSGILINFIDFTNLINKLGQPLKISSNGRNLMLKKSLD